MMASFHASVAYQQLLFRRNKCLPFTILVGILSMLTTSLIRLDKVDSKFFTPPVLSSKWQLLLPEFFGCRLSIGQSPAKQSPWPSLLACSSYRSVSGEGAEKGSSVPLSLTTTNREPGPPMVRHARLPKERLRNEPKGRPRRRLSR